MKAKEFRELMEKAIEEKRLADIEKNRKYAHRIINGGCRRRALKGLDNYRIVLRRWCTPSFVVDTIAELGFDVQRHAKNGKAILIIKW